MATKTEERTEERGEKEDAIEIRLRQFVSVKEPNTRFQVKQGTPEQNPPLITVNGAEWPLVRVGDKFATFQGGFCVTDDPDVIAFCESHPDIYDTEAMDVELKVALARITTETANYEPESSVDLVGLAQDVFSKKLNEAIEEQVQKRVAEELARRERE